MAINTNFAPALKRLWPQKRVKNLSYGYGTLYALMPKKYDFYGKSWELALRYGNPQGRSADLSVAQANRTDPKFAGWSIDSRGRDYGVIRVDRETKMASESNTGALLKFLDAQTEGVLKTVFLNLAMALYGNGEGVRGVIATGGIAGAVFTLSKEDDIVNFEVGQTIRKKGTTGSTTKTTVSAVDRENGKITVASATGWSAADEIIQDGDYDAAASAGLLVKGLAGWIPATAPTSGDSWWGVDRSVDVTRLAGHRIAYVTGKSIEQMLLLAGARMYREGAKPDHAFINPVDYNSLGEGTLSRAIQDLAKSEEGIIGFDGLKLNLASGPCKLLPDPHCPRGIVYMLRLDTWLLKFLGEPGIIDDDGLQMQRVVGADANFEMWAGYYAQLGCDAPGENARVAITA